MNPSTQANTIWVLQACDRKLNVPRDLDGTSCVQDLQAGYYRDTGFTADNNRAKRMINASARRGELKGYPADEYKFKWMRRAVE